MELPQLRSVTSMELGCDARGYSRAGNEMAIWYCVILAGRSSPELNKMHARIQEALSTVDNDQPSSLAAVALKEKRLTFTCRKKPKNMLEAFLNDDVDPASQLVARYNGSEESSEIIKAKTPALVPDDADPIWSVGAQTILSKGTGMKQRIGSIMNGIHNRLGDPRIGPMLLLGALMSFGGIWLRRRQSTHPSQSNNQTQPSKKGMMKIDQIRDARREQYQTKIVLLPSRTQNQKMLTRCHYQILTPSNRWCSKESGFDIKQMKHMRFSK
ncbi:unnamed protein product [Camellia sinensis]